MDRDVPEGIAYWLSSFDPDMEAIASEVALLRRTFPGSTAWGVSPSVAMTCSAGAGFGVNPRLHLLFRVVTRVRQSRYAIQHLFGGLGDWYHLRALGRHPAVMTVAVEGEPADADLLGKIDRFVVEWPGARDALERLGIPSGRISCVPPPVDLGRFTVAPRPDGRFSVLFASAPARSDWIEARGVGLVLDAAAELPEVRFTLL